MGVLSLSPKIGLGGSRSIETLLLSNLLFLGLIFREIRLVRFDPELRGLDLEKKLSRHERERSAGR